MLLLNGQAFAQLQNSNKYSCCGASKTHPATISFRLFQTLPDLQTFVVGYRGVFMKAIILTYASVQNYEREILLRTNIFKLALNQHAKDLKPNARIITDYTLPKILLSCPEKIISVREKLRYYSPRVEYPHIEFKGSTIIAAVDYLISKHYKEILIIGDNSVNSLQFRNEVNREIKKYSPKIKIYQYSSGNFNLSQKSVKEFLS